MGKQKQNSIVPDILSAGGGGGSSGMTQLQQPTMLSSTTIDSSADTLPTASAMHAPNGNLDFKKR